jgi:hypothetical protein
MAALVRHHLYHGGVKGHFRRSIRGRQRDLPAQLVLQVDDRRHPALDGTPDSLSHLGADESGGWEHFDPALCSKQTLDHFLEERPVQGAVGADEPVLPGSVAAAADRADAARGLGLYAGPIFTQCDAEERAASTLLVFEALLGHHRIHAVAKPLADEIALLGCFAPAASLLPCHLSP